MNSKISKRKDKINFLLENQHYRKLHLYLYLLTIAAIVLMYFLIVLTFSSYYNSIITAIISVVIGLYLVYNRDHIVKTISNRLQDKKIKKVKQENKQGLKTTLKRIKPKAKANRGLKLKIGGSVTMKDKLNNFTKKLKSTKGKTIQKEYIEIK